MKYDTERAQGETREEERRGKRNRKPGEIDYEEKHKRNIATLREGL